LKIWWEKFETNPKMHSNTFTFHIVKRTNLEGDKMHREVHKICKVAGIYSVKLALQTSLLRSLVGSYILFVVQISPLHISHSEKFNWIWLMNLMGEIWLKIWWCNGKHGRELQRREDVPVMLKTCRIFSCWNWMKWNLYSQSWNSKIHIEVSQTI
jgi:hypothetical protein